MVKFYFGWYLGVGNLVMFYFELGEGVSYIVWF